MAASLNKSEYGINWQLFAENICSLKSQKKKKKSQKNRKSTHVQMHTLLYKSIASSFQKKYAGLMHVRSQKPR